jgi:hypothetical protein
MATEIAATDWSNLLPTRFKHIYPISLDADLARGFLVCGANIGQLGRKNLAVRFDTLKN